MRTGLSVLLVGSVLVANALPVLADTSSALQRCREIPESQARFACYDAIPIPPLPAVGAKTVSTTVAPASAGQQTLQTEAAAGVTGPDPRFGLPTKASAQDAVESSIAGLFDGWVADTRFSLANGQVWQISDGSTAGYTARRDPSVRIARGVLGSYFMQVDGVSQTPRVKRLK